MVKRKVNLCEGAQVDENVGQGLEFVAPANEKKLSVCGGAKKRWTRSGILQKDLCQHPPRLDRLGK